MAKARDTAFFCKECGYESAKWFGQCPACREWNTASEEPVAKIKTAKGKGAPVHIVSDGKNEPSKLADINTKETDRMSTGIKELDRVLGGGIVAGSLVLVGGDPGIGKSTLLLQMCKNLSTFIFSLIRAVGLILLGWGIVQVGLSLQSHDPSQRSQGFLTLAGGLVITFAKEILDLITA